jgi:hypothetical protein
LHLRNVVGGTGDKARRGETVYFFHGKTLHFIENARAQTAGERRAYFSREKAHRYSRSQTARGARKHFAARYEYGAQRVPARNHKPRYLGGVVGHGELKPNLKHHEPHAKGEQQPIAFGKVFE